MSINHSQSERPLIASRELLERSLKVIPGASQTFSKSRLQYVEHAAPLFLARGSGCHVWDVDGNEYLDFVSGLGAVSLGYCHPDVDAAVAEQMRSGVSFSLPTELEVQVAERLVDLIPCAEMVRFGKNGSDVTAGAVRLARAFTGRDRIACCGYHGWQDWYIGATTRNLGVPDAVSELTHRFAYNDLDGLKQLLETYPGEFAAVILEPISLSDPEPGFLEGVKQIAHKNGALLVFDEVVTGFRFDLRGAQHMLGVTPDLACFGKAMANGFPLSALVGRREIMSMLEEVFFSFTAGGEAASLAAALATMRVMEDEDAIERAWRMGERIQTTMCDAVASLGLEGRVTVEGKACWPVTMFRGKDGQQDLILKSLFQQEVLRNGILWLGTYNLTLSHAAEDLDRLFDVSLEALKVVREAIDRNDAASRLIGPPVQPVFTVRSAP